MQHNNRFSPLRDVEHPKLTIFGYLDLSYTATDRLHRAPVQRFATELQSKQLFTGATTSSDSPDSDRVYRVAQQ